MYICQNNSNNQVVENIVKKDLINRKNELKVVAQAFIFDCGFVGYRLHFHSSNHCHNFDYCLN